MYVFELESFLKLQHVAPNGNVLGHCSAFALVLDCRYQSSNLTLCKKADKRISQNIELFL